jgi:16S rRNA (uracil1498-N3)-methyltransferase
VVGRRRAPAVIVLLPGGDVSPDQLLHLGHDEAHHLRVRRAEPGQHVALRDGAGLTGEAVLLESTPKHALIRLIEVSRAAEPVPLELFVAAGDKDRFGWLVEKAAELGVTRIVPVATERTVGVASGITSSHLSRLRRRALDAIKQSGAAWAPVIADVVRFDEILGSAGGSLRWLADAAGAWPEERLDDGPAAVIIGPEGGLTAREREAACAAGWTPVRLGASILRFETAAIAAAVSIGLARGRAT